MTPTNSKLNNSRDFDWREDMNSNIEECLKCNNMDCSLNTRNKKETQSD